MEKRYPWNDPLEVFHYTIVALANFCVFKLFLTLVPMLIFDADSDQNPWAIFWICNLDQYHNLQQLLVAYITHAW